MRICNTILVEGLILLYIKKKKTCIEDFPKEKKTHVDEMCSKIFFASHTSAIRGIPWLKIAESFALSLTIVYSHKYIVYSTYYDFPLNYFLYFL